jgi:hypothetical protein
MVEEGYGGIFHILEQLEVEVQELLVGNGAPGGQVGQVEMEEQVSPNSISGSAVTRMVEEVEVH